MVKRFNSPIFAVLIDVDGVILNTEDHFAQGMKRAYREFVKTYGRLVSLNEFEKLYLIARDMVKRLHAGHGLSSSRLLYFKTMFNLMSLPFNLDNLRRITEAYWDGVLKRSKPSKGLIEFLELCKHNFIRVGVITELDIDTQITKVERVLGKNWSDHIDVVVTTHEVGVNKKNPSIYLYAMNLLGMNSPHNVLLIDNDMENIRAASLIGMQTIHFGTEAKDFRDVIASVSLERNSEWKDRKVVFLDLFGVVVKEPSFSKIFMAATGRKPNKYKYMLWSMGIISNEEFGVSEKDVERIIEHIEINRKVLKVVESLRSREVCVGVLSNIPRTIYERLGVEEYFDKNLVIISGDYRRRKPDSVLTYISLKKANTDPRNVYFVDDRAENLRPARVYKANTVLYMVRPDKNVYPWVNYKIGKIESLLRVVK